MFPVSVMIDSPPRPDEPLRYRPSNRLWWTQRAWRRLKSWYAARSELAKDCAQAHDYASMQAIRREEETRRAAILSDQLASALETVKQRDLEIERLTADKAKLQATIDVREHELKEMSLWQARSRATLQADLAVQAMREYRATDVNARPIPEGG